MDIVLLKLISLKQWKEINSKWLKDPFVLRPLFPAVSFQVALYIWENGNGPHLTAVPELCTEPDDSPQTFSRCATTLSRELPLCVSFRGLGEQLEVEQKPRGPTCEVRNSSELTESCAQ